MSATILPDTHVSKMLEVAKLYSFCSATCKESTMREISWFRSCLCVEFIWPLPNKSKNKQNVSGSCFSPVGSWDMLQQTAVTLNGIEVGIDNEWMDNESVQVETQDLFDFFKYINMWREKTTQSHEVLLKYDKLTHCLYSFKDWSQLLDSTSPHSSAVCLSWNWYFSFLMPNSEVEKMQHDVKLGGH